MWIASPGRARPTCTLRRVQPLAAAMEPVYQKFLMEAEQYDVKVCRINVTDDIALGERFHVKDLPTMLVFRDGMRVHTTEGIVLPEHYTNLLKFY